MAEWLRRGLQILARRFDSGSGLHFSQQCESAALAQLVEHIIRNDGVRCSSHLSGTTSGQNWHDRGARFFSIHEGCLESALGAPSDDLVM